MEFSFAFFCHVAWSSWNPIEYNLTFISPWGTKAGPLICRIAPIIHSQIKGGLYQSTAVFLVPKITCTAGRNRSSAWRRVHTVSRPPSLAKPYWVLKTSPQNHRQSDGKLPGKPRHRPYCPVGSSAWRDVSKSPTGNARDSRHWRGAAISSFDKHQRPPANDTSSPIGCLSACLSDST